MQRLRLRDRIQCLHEGPEKHGPPSMVSDTNAYEHYSMLESTLLFENDS